MWWCGSPPEGESGDHIYYATSNDGLHWSEPTVVLSHTGGEEGIHTCDPSVVKVDNKYFMYYTSDSFSLPGNGNQIFLATSTDGVHWTKYPSNSNPQPVIPCENPDGSYCVGGSSVLYLNNQFIHYFVDTTGRDGPGIYIAYSGDGMHFTRGNDGHKVNSVNDVKYVSGLGLYFAVYEGYPSWDYIAWNISPDGINWLPSDNARVIEETKECTHNPGILGSLTGTMETESIVYYGAGSKTVDGSCWNPYTWGIDASTIIVSLVPTATPTPTPTLIPGDANGDGVVDGADLELLKQDYLGSPANSRTDFNSDERVDCEDFAILQANYPQ